MPCCRGAVGQVVVVGGGWAGFGAASQLARAGVKVTLLEAQPSAGGLAAGWETAKGNRWVIMSKSQTSTLRLIKHECSTVRSSRNRFADGSHLSAGCVDGCARRYA